MQKRMGHMRILGCHGCAARGMNMGMNHILLVLGHPAPNRFLHALAEHYQRGALAAGAHVRVLDLAQLTFDPILRDGYEPINPSSPTSSARSASWWRRPTWCSSSPCGGWPRPRS
jgi:hypothetical protein